ncbi:MAG: alpha/beta hydrolase [Acidobacteriota bacterium]|nr:alpha/beta hydrolase [Acidobacteriota bacterium]
MRTILIGCWLSLMLAGVGFAQVANAPAADQAAAEGKRILLWADVAPGAKGSGDEDRPTLTVYLPEGQNATRTGVVVAPGGGYTHLAVEKEGTAYARWLNARGVAAFVLEYRLGPKYHYPVELEDAQRAIRTVRAHAAEYGMAADHVGMWGSSAGGHLAATAGTHFDAGNAAGADAVERQGSRPDFLILAYPVITFEEPQLHRGSKLYLLGEHPDPALVASLSDETQVTATTPPAFLFATTDDPVVPVMNSVMFYSALVKAGVPAEMHLFQHGAHGAGLAVGNPELSGWPELLAKWMRERGYMAAGMP